MFQNNLLAAAASALSGFEVTFVTNTGRIVVGATNPLTISSVDMGS